MPESIEVLQYRDFINKHLGRKESFLLDVKILKGRYKNKGVFSGYAMIKKLAKKEVLKNPKTTGLLSKSLKFVNVESKGKFMYFTFTNLNSKKSKNSVSGSEASKDVDDSKNLYLGVTLGLSGGWFFKPKNSKKLINGLDTERFEDEIASKYLEAALKHINVEFVFNSGTLYFYDQLSYGTLKVFDEKSLQAKLKSLGVDMSDPNTSYDDFYNALTKNVKNDSKAIGNLIVNQKLISGVGNYLRADSLWASRISPFRKLKDISETELKKLYHQIRVLIYGAYNKKLGKRLKIIKLRDKLPSDYKRGFWVYKMESDIYGHEVLIDTLYEGSQKRFIYYTEIQK